MDKIRGEVAYVLGDDINTDKILAGRYLVLTGDDELAEHCFEGHIKDWNQKVKNGDILVAGENFGCGSSREHAPIALKGSGISVVIAESFGRIFYRNSIAVGLPVIIATNISKQLKPEDIIEVDVNEGNIFIERTKVTIPFDPFPKFIQEYLDVGGLTNYVKKHKKNNLAAS